MKKTNAIRVLDRQKVEYELVEYKYDPDNLDVSKIAGDNNLPLNLIYKTLIAKGDKTGIVVAVIPGRDSLCLKQLAKASGNKKITLLPVRDLQASTGYIRGGCSPIGMKKNFPVWVDRSAQTLKQLFVNAGKRGLLVGLSPIDITKACPCEFADLTQ